MKPDHFGSFDSLASGMDFGDFNAKYDNFEDYVADFPDIAEDDLLHDWISYHDSQA